MARENLSNNDSSKITPPFPMNVLEMNKNWLDPFMEAQTELLNEMQEMNQKWTSRVSSEANLASELVSKITSARSLPNVAEAYQDWLQQHIQFFAEDSRQLMSNSQKVMQAGMRAFTNGRPAGGT